jgi:LmbE family N-acetylglucosaminyl deacetylase
MINVKLSQKKSVLKVLCLGAHSDDIEIGCGGSVLKLIQEYRRTSFSWVVFSSNEIRKREAEKSAEAFLVDAERNVVVLNKFRDGFFPYSGGEIKDYFEELKRELDPDLIFTHQRLDLHQDHRLISELTWNTFRDHLILEYEIPKYDGDLGAPNVFTHLDEAICKKKVRYILEHFKSQASNQWFAEEAFQAIMRLRGIESNSASQYAEAFYCRKLALV